MAVTGTKTVRDIIHQGYRKAGILGIGEDLPGDYAETGKDELEAMLKSWQNSEFNLWTKTSGSHTLTAAASQTLDPIRPLRILSARFKRGNTEIPMVRLTRDEYDSFPNKATTGTPTQFYYDRQREAARLFVWPVLATASGETIEFTYERELEDIASINDVADVPGEWWNATIYNLAVHLQETVPTRNLPPRVAQRAQILLDEALGFDQEDSVFFAGEYAG